MSPRVFSAPGRVNLIGEHTDYNDGFVMPLALEFRTWVTAAPRADRLLVFRSENFPETCEFNLDDPEPRPSGNWSDYVRGVAVSLRKAGCRLMGATLSIRGDVPIGAGLSSSAALEVATARALLGISGIEMPPDRIARICQQAENEFVGMQCGIMDQFTACHASPGTAIMLDCRSLEYKPVALPAGAKVIISNTMVRHELAGSEYNRRRAECAAGVQHLALALPHISALRDVSLQDLEQHGAGMPDAVYRRCRHVITENCRVQEAFTALDQQDLPRFGRLMNASHESLRDDFEVSCRELDSMAGIASKLPGVFGARMTGGGFGGCVVSLVAEEHAAAFGADVKRLYGEATGKDPLIYG